MAWASVVENGGREAAVFIAVVNDTAAAVKQECVAAVDEQAGVIGSRDQVQIAVGVEVGPVEDGSRAGDTGQRLDGEAARRPGFASS